MLFWSVVILAVIAAAIIAAILFRHRKEIRLLDPDTIRSEQERKTRDHIVTMRFQRRLAQALMPVRRIVRSASDRATRSYRQVEERLSRLSAQTAPADADASVGSANSLSIRQSLAQAAEFMSDGRFAEAERAYLEVLKQDERQLDAYRGLGALYLVQKQYVQAKETFQFLERIHGADDACFAGLAEIAEAVGNKGEAERMRERASEAAPKSAVRHAELAAFYLSNGSPDFALSAARRAVELEPDAPRHLELCLEAAILVRDRSEAERCFDRLRLVTDNRNKVQAYRKKIDEMAAK